MGRPVYPYELTDPDFSWLLSNFQEHFPNYVSIQSECLPVVFVAADMTSSGVTEEIISSASTESALANDQSDLSLADGKKSV